MRSACFVQRFARHAAIWLLRAIFGSAYTSSHPPATAPASRLFPASALNRFRGLAHVIERVLALALTPKATYLHLPSCSEPTEEELAAAEEAARLRAESEDRREQERMLREMEEEVQRQVAAKEAAARKAQADLEEELLKQIAAGGDDVKKARHSPSF